MSATAYYIMLLFIFVPVSFAFVVGMVSDGECPPLCVCWVLATVALLYFAIDGCAKDRARERAEAAYAEPAGNEGRFPNVGA